MRLTNTGGARRLACALAALGVMAAAGPANAESFTFKSTTKLVDRVQLPGSGPNARPTGASVSQVEVETTYASGRIVKTSGKCATWILPPGAQFGSNSACTYTDASGELYTAQYTCETPSPAQHCWGKLVGTGGAFKGRSGAFSLRAGTPALGAGLWTD